MVSTPPSQQATGEFPRMYAFAGVQVLTEPWSKPKVTVTQIYQIFSYNPSILGNF